MRKRTHDVRMLLYVEKKLYCIIGNLFSSVFIRSALFSSSTILCFSSSRKKRFAERNSDLLPTILLDAGHGGFDGGSVALNGVIEKDINLAIAKKIKEQLVLLGFPVVMTRETDCSLEDDSGLSIRQRKVSDIHNREKLANSLVEPLLFLSIHQNKYEGASSFGTQIFYGCCRPESQEIAQFLQSFLRQELQPENHREIKQGTSDIYLLKILPVLLF